MTSYVDCQGKLTALYTADLAMARASFITNVWHPTSSISHEASRRVDLTTPLSHNSIQGSIDIRELIQRVALWNRFE